MEEEYIGNVGTDVGCAFTSETESLQDGEVVDDHAAVLRREHLIPSECEQYYLLQTVIW